MYPEGARLHRSVSPPQAQAGITHREEVEVGRQPVWSSLNVFVCIYSRPINTVTPRLEPFQIGNLCFSFLQTYANIPTTVFC